MAAGEEAETGHVRRPSGKRTGPKTMRTTGGARTDKAKSERGAEHPVRRVSVARAMRCAAQQLQELLGRAPEMVSAVKPTEDGWQADVEVLELARVPSTTSVLATYRVALDEEGELVAYERIRRYTRGQIDRR
ncbi:gas vesicle protein GvpO [Streptomyces sp. NPDC039016]|uniref:gas vesicle protein GvpO n=1 Tax=Streptomyces sp. NPDC039016 TaxID=3154330 RepID=UPI00340BC785